MEQGQSAWLTLAEVALRLRTTQRTVSRLVKQGKLPAVYLSVGQGYRVKASDVDALGSAQQREAQA
jgi:excisionase family DNA binding protein